jgi:RNA polymerase sigma-32 factor
MGMQRARTSVDDYIDSLKGIHPLDADTEYALALRYQQGDEDAGRRLVEASLPFVIRIAVEYRRWGAPLEDVVQQGNLGLLHAARKFDVTKKVRLISYAVYWIRAEIREYLVRTYRIVRLGTTRSERRAIRAYRREGAAGPEELAERSGMPLQRCCMLWPLITQHDSFLDAETDERGPAIERVVSEIPNPEQAYGRRHELEQARAAVRRALRRLTPRERRIARARLLSESPVTLQCLGDELGVSKERVRQLECRVRDKLRDALSAYADMAA